MDIIYCLFCILATIVSFIYAYVLIDEEQYMMGFLFAGFAIAHIFIAFAVLTICIL